MWLLVKICGKCVTSFVLSLKLRGQNLLHEICYDFSINPAVDHSRYLSGIYGLIIESKKFNNSFSVQ